MEESMQFKPFIVAACVVPCLALAGDNVSVFQKSQLQWTELPEPFLRTQIAAVDGDMSKEGPFIARWRCPDNYKAAPHTHPATEYFTVIEGTLLIAEGETFQESKLKPVSQGSSAIVPANKPHYGVCKGTTVIEIHATGPWGTTMLEK
jgi:mannose-6-phosphate isomerase-like protein (cupin superfamily)